MAHVPDRLRDLPVRTLEEAALKWPAGKLRRTPLRWVSPLEFSPRMAILGEKGKDSQKTRYFSYGDWTRIGAFSPEALGVDAETLPRLLRDALAGKCPLRPVHSLVVFTGPGSGWITDSDRETTWEAFGVPVYEQISGPFGERLAWECEAHAGLHVEQSHTLFETAADGQLLFTSFAAPDLPCFRIEIGLGGVVETVPCACGRPGPRITSLRAMRGRESVSAAA